MRIMGLILTMLVAFYGTSIWMVACVEGMTCNNMGIALVLALFTGTFVVIPVFAYLFGADFIANRFGFPWNLLSYVALVAIGCALYTVAFHHIKESPLELPTSGERWLAALTGYLPILAPACILLLHRIAASIFAFRRVD
jgi:hypothetical protein